MPEGALHARHSQLPAWHQGEPGPLPDPPPLQHILHATGHGRLAADLQRVAGAHCQDQIVLQQSRLHAAPPQHELLQVPLHGQGSAKAGT